MVFDQTAFENIEYLHPGHKVISKVKWRVKKKDTPGLIGIVVIN